MNPDIISPYFSSELIELYQNLSNPSTSISIWINLFALNCNQNLLSQVFFLSLRLSFQIRNLSPSLIPNPINHQRNWLCVLNLKAINFSFTLQPILVKTHKVSLSLNLVLPLCQKQKLELSKEKNYITNPVTHLIGFYLSNTKQSTLESKKIYKALSYLDYVAQQWVFVWWE